MASTAEEFKQQGTAKFSEGKFDEAAELFTRAIELDPTNHILFANRSACLLNTGKPSEALADAEKCTQIAPAWGKGYLRLAKAHEALGNIQAAHEAIEKGLEKEPSNQMLMGYAQELQSKALSAMMSQTFGPDMMDRLAANPQTANLIKDPEVVRKLEMVRANPTVMTQFFQDPKFLKCFAVLSGIGDLGIGNDTEEERESQDTFTPPTTGSRREEVPAAQPEPEPQQEMTPEEMDRQQRKEAATKLYKERKFEEALKGYSELAEEDEDNPVYPMNCSAVCLSMKDYEKAEEWAQKAYDICQRTHASYEQASKALTRAGKALLLSGQYRKAVKTLEKAGMEMENKEQRELLREAKRLLREEKKKSLLDPAKCLADKEEGNKLFTAGDYAGAVKKFTEALTHDPSNVACHNNRAAAFFKLGEWGEAEKDSETVLESDPDNIKALIRLGKIHNIRKQLHKALDMFQRVLDICPTSVEAREGMQNVMTQVYKQRAEGKLSPEQREAAMKDPEIQALLTDPEVSRALTVLQTNPSASEEIMRSPKLSAKLTRLMIAGVI